MIKNKYPNDSIPSNGKKFEPLEIKNGFIYINNNLANYEDVDFIITKNNELFLGRKHQFLSKNEDVIAAGTLKIVGGIVRRIGNDSGHYLPTKEEALKFPKLFKDLGCKFSDEATLIILQIIDNKYHTEYELIRKLLDENS
jgi:hypothetical protein